MVPSWISMPCVTVMTQPWLRSWITSKQRQAWVTLGPSATSSGHSSIWTKWESFQSVPFTKHSILLYCIDASCLLLIVYWFLYICTLLSQGCGRVSVFLYSETVKFIKRSLLSELAWGQAAIFLLKCSDQKNAANHMVWALLLFFVYFVFWAWEF